MASIRKGRWSNIFPALRSTTGHLTHDPEEKATLLKQRFFPDEPRVVEEAQPSDPPPRPTRTWSQITVEEVTLALSTAKNSSAPGPSGVGYTTLKWIHQVRPDVLTDLYNNCLDAGTHPWKEATVVVINKPGKPDYSAPKAYRPISLLECMGKLLEKIVAKRFNRDIEEHSLLAMTQFGSRPQHNAVDAVSVLIHRVQATIATGHVGALLLFDISGFFDNINPTHMAHLLTLLGFPTTVCQWTLSFLTGRQARLKIGEHTSAQFDITNGTPQGSPLSPILSALYTAHVTAGPGIALVASLVQRVARGDAPEEEES